jgi:hypothetical protein
MICAEARFGTALVLQAAVGTTCLYRKFQRVQMVTGIFVIMEQMYINREVCNIVSYLRFLRSSLFFILQTSVSISDPDWMRTRMV